MFHEVDTLQQFLRALAYVHLPHTIDAAEEFHIFGHCQILIERETLAHITYMAFDQLTLRHHIESCHRAAALSGVRQAAEHPHRSGLACTVGTQESENLAPPHVEADAVHGSKRAEPLGQTFYFYDIIFHFAIFQ